MHPFFFMGVICHAIVLAVVAFFVLFAASKADGPVKLLGNVLGYLLLIGAVLCIVGAITAPLFGGHPFGITGPCIVHPGMGPHWGHMPTLQVQTAPPPGK